MQIRNAEAGALMELQPSGPDPLELPWEARAVALARIGFGVSPTRISYPDLPPCRVGNQLHRETDTPHSTRDVILGPGRAGSPGAPRARVCWQRCGCTSACGHGPAQDGEKGSRGPVAPSVLPEDSPSCG